MKISKQEYDVMNRRASARTRHWVTLPVSFLVGGGICTFGQALLNFYRWVGLQQTDAGTMVSVTLIFLTVLFTGLSLFHRLAKFAGAGTLVPITGFANAMVSPALEFKSEGFVLGLGAKLFVIAGPVLVYGISASILYGIILYLFEVFGG